MPSWSFTGENPLLFTPSLLKALADYEALAGTKGASAEALGAKALDIRRQLGLAERGPMSPFAQAGQRLQDPIFTKQYPGSAPGITHEFDRYMPPIRAGEGMYIVGKPDVVGFDQAGRPSYVHDIKTAFRTGPGITKPLAPDIFAQGNDPRSLVGKAASYANSFQNVYATALGLPAIDYRVYGFNSPNARSDEQLGYATRSGTAPSITQLGQWAKAGIRTLDRLGLTSAAERHSQKLWESAFRAPMQYWGQEHGTLAKGFESATGAERDMFYNEEAAALFASQDRERILDQESLQRYVPGQPKTNSGFSIEDRLNARSEVRAINMGGEGSHGGGRGVGEWDPEGLSFDPHNYATSRYISFRSKGDIQSANKWRSLMSPDASWADVFEQATQDYNTTREQRLADRRERLAVSREIAGDTAGAEAIRGATGSINELNAVLIKLGESSRKAADSERRRDNALSAMSSAQPYDWTRWYKARGEAWGNIQQGASWLPGFITGPGSRFGTAMMQAYGARVSSMKGPYDAFMNGAMPIGAALGSLIPGGTLIGGAMGGGVSAISQIIGNIGEGRIRAQGLGISSQLNMWGGVADIASSVVGTSLKALLLPLDLFGKALKIAVPSLLGFGAALASTMASGFSKMNALGNPLTSLTGGSTYADFQRSQFADIMSGMGSGSTSSAVQKMASMRQGMMLGRLDTNQMVSAAMLGEFGTFYNMNAGEGYADYNGMITRFARKMHGQTGSEQARNMFYLQDIDPTMASHVQTLLQKYAVSKDTSMTWEQYTTPRVFRDISKERVKFREENFDYQGMKAAFDIDKIRIASRLWNAFGENVLAWTEELYNMIGSGASFKDIAQYIGSGFRSIWDATVGPMLKDGFKDFVQFLRTGLSSLVKALPDLAAAIKPAFMHIADTGFDVIWSLGETIWNTIRGVIVDLGSIRIDPKNIGKFLSGEGTLADVFKLTSAPAAETQASQQYVKNATGAMRGSFYDDRDKKRTFYSMNANKPGYYGWFVNTNEAGGAYLESLKGLYDWENQTSFKGLNPRQMDRVQEILEINRRSAIANKFSPAQAFRSLEQGLSEAGFSKLAGSIGAFVDSKGYDPLRKTWDAVVGSREETRANMHKGIDALFSDRAVAAAGAGLSTIGNAALNLTVTLVDDSGHVLATIIDKVDQGTSKAIDATANLLNRARDNLNNLEIDRAQARLLRIRAAGAVH